MAGGVTVVKKATRNVLARLGRKNVHRDRVGANDADPNAKASPLTAVWAIVQAYALVALVLTVYNSIFAGDGRVPDDVQVLLGTRTRTLASRERCRSSSCVALLDAPLAKKNASDA